MSVYNQMQKDQKLNTNSVTDIVVPNLPVVSAGSLEEYISFVNSIPILTEQEEQDLARQWYDNENVEAARYLVLTHLRLVVSIARGYLGYGLPLADIIQEGTIGLMKAVKRFDPTKKVRLVTFAIHWIRAEINDFVIKNWRIVKTVTTKNHRKLFFNLRQLREEIGNLSDSEAERIANELNVTKSEVIEMNMRLTGGDVGIIADSEDGQSPIDWLSAPNTEPEYILEQKETEKLYTEGINSALDCLDDRSRTIILSRWLCDDGAQKTLQELAEHYGISAERVRQIEVKAMQKMKLILAEYKK